MDPQVRASPSDVVVRPVRRISGSNGAPFLSQNLTQRFTDGINVIHRRGPTEA